VLLHLTPAAQWEATPAASDFVSESFDDEGFIHGTHGEAALLAVGNRYYRDDPRPYVLLVVDPARLSSPVKYEDQTGLYPHVFGPIDRAAIMRLRSIERQADGTFVAIGPELPLPPAHPRA
jgi:uncharacterized protein (DUF952 family)